MGKSSSQESFSNQVAQLSHSLVQLERAVFFGDLDNTDWLPTVQIEDAKLMVPPYVGENYRTGGLVFIGINPGGGNVSSGSRNFGDELIYPVSNEFKNCLKDIEAIYWNDFVPNFARAKKSYPIYRQHMLEVLEASGCSLSNISYFNFLPYRGRDNKYPKLKTEMEYVVPQCIKHYVRPLLSLLNPSMVVLFGKQVDTYIRKFWSDFPYATVFWNRAWLTDDVLASRRDSKSILNSWRISHGKG